MTVGELVQDLWQGLGGNLGEFGRGASITVMGMGLVFAALGLLMLVMSGLQLLFRPEQAAASAPAMPPRPLPIEVGGAEPPEEVAAAIAVAIAMLRQRQEVSQPPETTVVTFTPGTSAWRALGRLS